MQKEFITINYRQTQKLGEFLAGELRGGEVVCLSGELGAGKTTFTQGLLRGLGVKGPYSSPTFVIMKEYQVKIPISKSKYPNKSQNSEFKIQNVFHIDAYRVRADDILGLGWKEIVENKNNVVIIEWAERVEKIVPKGSLWIKLEWQGDKERKIAFNSKYQINFKP